MLILPIKKKWFDMILFGEKKEDYREIRPYYRSRLYHNDFLDQYGLPTIKEGWIAFRNGYSKNSPLLHAFCTLDIKTGKPEWGAEIGKEYYVFSIIGIYDMRGSLDEMHLISPPPTLDLSKARSFGLINVKIV